MNDFDYLKTSFSEPINFEEEKDYFLRRDNGIPVQPGDKLPNGAIILDEKVIRVFPHRRDSIVLAVASGYQPFVSWVRSIHSDIPETNEDGTPNTWYNIKDHCEAGSYHSDLTDAVNDFVERVEQKVGLLS